LACKSDAGYEMADNLEALAQRAGPSGAVSADTIRGFAMKSGRCARGQEYKLAGPFLPQHNCSLPTVCRCPVNP
jgi:hypothetical protein